MDNKITPEELSSKIHVGTKMRFDYGESDNKSQLCHVR